MHISFQSDSKTHAQCFDVFTRLMSYVQTMFIYLQTGQWIFCFLFRYIIKAKTSVILTVTSVTLLPFFSSFEWGDRRAKHTVSKLLQALHNNLCLSQSCYINYTDHVFGIFCTVLYNSLDLSMMWTSVALRPVYMIFHGVMLYSKSEVFSPKTHWSLLFSRHR